MELAFFANHGCGAAMLDNGAAQADLSIVSAVVKRCTRAAFAPSSIRRTCSDSRLAMLRLVHTCL